MKTFFKITTSLASYYCVVSTSKNSGNLIFYLGGEEYVCLEVVSNDLDIKNHLQCTINHTDKVSANDMIYALLFLIKTKFQKYCKIHLTDMSQNDIGNLSSYYLAFYQHTWYEKDFNAYLENNNINEKYNLLKNDFNDKKFTDQGMDGFLIAKLDDTKRQQIIDIYTNSINYKTFFQNIKTKIDKSQLKDYITSWLDLFIKEVLGFKIINFETWIIDCNNVSLPNITIEELSTDPYNGVYTNIKQLIQKGGSIILTERQRKSFKNPRWIGWCNIKYEDYSIDDQTYLKGLIKNE